MWSEANRFDRWTVEASKRSPSEGGQALSGLERDPQRHGKRLRIDPGRPHEKGTLALRTWCVSV